MPIGNVHLGYPSGTRTSIWNAHLRYPHPSGMFTWDIDCVGYIDLNPEYPKWTPTWVMGIHLGHRTLILSYTLTYGILDVCIM